MEILNFEDFFYETWEKVPSEVVNDYVWSNNIDLIKELTFVFYNIYYNSIIIKDNYITSEMDPQRTANLLISIFSTINKIGIII